MADGLCLGDGSCLEALPFGGAHKVCGTARCHHTLQYKGQRDHRTTCL